MWQKYKKNWRETVPKGRKLRTLAFRVLVLHVVNIEKKSRDIEAEVRESRTHGRKKPTLPGGKRHGLEKKRELFRALASGFLVAKRQKTRRHKEGIQQIEITPRIRGGGWNQKRREKLGR